MTERSWGRARPPVCYAAAVTSNGLLASVVIGSVGLGLFVYGKRQRRYPHLVAGILLMVYPYFVPGVGAMAMIAVALLGLLYLATYLGI